MCLVGTGLLEFDRRDIHPGEPRYAVFQVAASCRDAIFQAGEVRRGPRLQAAHEAHARGTQHTADFRERPDRVGPEVRDAGREHPFELASDCMRSTNRAWKRRDPQPPARRSATS